MKNDEVIKQYLQESGRSNQKAKVQVNQQPIIEYNGIKENLLSQLHVDSSQKYKSNANDRTASHQEDQKPIFTLNSPRFGAIKAPVKDDA